MDIVVTDVTEMQSGVYCVAGWDSRASRMVRPLPDGANWSADLLTKHGIIPGAKIHVVPKGTPIGPFPHRTEDMAINSSEIEVLSGEFSDWMGQFAPPVSENLNAGFGGNLKWNSIINGAKKGVYVHQGVGCSSLTAIHVQRTNLSFFESFEKLRAIFFDGSDRYELAVSSRTLKEAWRDGGVNAISSALPSRQTFHVRVGLARAFKNSPECYAMLNGVL